MSAMAATGQFLAWSLLLPVLLQAFYLPSPDSPAWDPSLSSAPLLDGSLQESPSSAPLAVPHSDPYAHEVSSGDRDLSDENWRGASPSVHSGTPAPTMLFDFPAVTSPGLGPPADAPARSLASHLSVQGLPQGGDFTLSTVGPSGAQKQSEDIDHGTVEPSPGQGKDESSLSLPGVETAIIATARALSPSFRGHASGIATSPEEATHSYPQAGISDVTTVTTVSSRPIISTISLVTLPADRPHIKWMSTEATVLMGRSTVPEQELLGRNQTTVKYLASFRSTQAYVDPQGTKDFSTSPFRPTQATGYTHKPPGPWKGTVQVTSTPQAPQLTSGAAVSPDGKSDGLPPLPVSPHLPAPDEFLPSPSASSSAGTQRPVERNTHWGLIIHATRQAGPRDTSGTEQTHSRGSSADPGIGGVIDVDPQRVRGAVNPKAPATYIGSSTPGASVVGKGPGPRHPDAAGTRPPEPSSSTTSAHHLATPRRGFIRVTTQRTLQHPQLARPEPSLSATLPASSLPCPRPGSDCSQLLPNQTLLRWRDLEHTLSFAWALHVYGSGVLFLLLSLLSLACLVGSLAVRVPHLPYVAGASALLLVFGVLRATFFLADPYGSRGWLAIRAVRVLYTAPFPLLLSTFMVLLFRLLRQAHLQILPPKLQSLPLLAALGSTQSIVLLMADLPPLHPSVTVGLHTLSCAAGFSLLPATVFVYWQLRHSAGAEGTPEPGVWSGAWVLLANSGLMLPCCGLQLYGEVWLSGLLGQPDVFTWGWWFVQFWFRIGELVLSFTLLFLAWQSLCQRYGAAEHSCWAKLMRYFCTYRKAEVPEYPNNCYDWTGGVLEKVPNNDISKSLIRNPPSSGRLWALKDSNELRAAAGQGSSPSPVHPIYSPKCPNAAVAVMGRSYTSICFERDSVISLAELEFRPPSPINLSRSIDEALFREHLVRDSIFLRSSLHFPSRLARQDSCTSLRGDCSTLSHTAQPLLARPRRSSDPDCLYSLARASSMGELTTQSRGLASEPATDTSFDSFTRTSFSRASLKISWNPWRHGLSSPESLPPEELPSQAQLLPDELPPVPSSSAPNSEREARKSFLALSKQVDSRSLSSDTIEL